MAMKQGAQNTAPYSVTLQAEHVLAIMVIEAGSKTRTRQRHDALL
jgi:hypothetical protein